MTFECDQTGINSWVCYQPDGRSDATKIESSLSLHPCVSCQFWVKGLPSVCSHWVDGKCNQPKASGYGDGSCDGIGRKSWCDLYDGSGTSEEYICIAPSIERSGLGTYTVNPDGSVSINRMPIANIKGYNDGKCDGQGTGRGSGVSDDFTSLIKLPIVCNYYRPFSMSFGAFPPQEAIKDSNGNLDVEEMIKIALDARNYRLPFLFKVYNYRAKALKCAFWDQDTGANFSINIDTGEIELLGANISEGKVKACVCEDYACDPYRTVDGTDGSISSTLKNVWSKTGGCVVCNGAKPECPCYTGNWVYNTDEKLTSGMRISAEQILELRFWAHNWKSQEEYDKFFAEAPGPNDDSSTSDIYTFTKWGDPSKIDPGESIMEGKKLNLCLPSDPRNCTFSKEKYIREEPVVYPSGYSNIGTSTSSQFSFPTLIRGFDLPPPTLLEIFYPYLSANPFNSESTYGCDSNGGDGNTYIKYSNKIEGDNIFVVGFTIRNRPIYLINKNIARSFDISFLESYGSSFLIPPEQREAVSFQINSMIKSVEANDTGGVGLKRGYSDKYGVFIVGPIDLIYNEDNTLIVLVEVSSGEYEFRTANVMSKWCGGVVIQTEFGREADESGDSGIYCGDILLFNPKAFVKGNAVGFNCKAKSVKCFEKRVVTSQLGMFDVYNYVIKRVTKQSQEISNWIRVGNAGTLLLDISDTNLNYVYNWEFISGSVSYSGEDEKNGGSFDLELILPQSHSDRYALPSNVIIVRPKDNKIHWVSGEVSVIINYWYEYLDSNTECDSDEIIVCPDLSAETNRFIAGTLIIEGIDNFSIKNIVYRNSPAIISEFENDDGFLICAVATKFLCEIALVKCRSVEANYKWVSDGGMYRLEPSSGFAYAEKASTPTFIKSINSTNTPLCGDHELSFLMKVGPMWFPFDACEKTEYYDVVTPGNFCTAPHEDTPRDDYRACGPDAFLGWQGDGGGVSDCTNPWIQGYIENSVAVFGGYANIVPEVNLFLYEAEGWSPPPFGNVSRELIEKYLTQDYITYMFLGKVYNEWAPMVPDVDMFGTTFNSFYVDNVDYCYDKPIYTNQLSYFMSEYIGESLEKGVRYNFDDLIESRVIRTDAYPHPSGEDDSGVFCAFYMFKHEDTAWVWRENQKSIQRLSQERLLFLDPDYQGYIYDIYKKEFILTVLEGNHNITFYPPKIENDGSISEPASIRLDSGPKRFFELIYDIYDGSRITWLDEYVGGSEEGGGEELPNPYGETGSYDDWIHSENVLFEEGYSISKEDAEVAGHKIYYEYDWYSASPIYKYFNRGIVANIYRNRLQFLPYEEVIISLIPDPYSSFQLGQLLLESDYSINFGGRQGAGGGDGSIDSYCLSMIEVNVTTGVSATDKHVVELCVPGISVITKVGTVGEAAAYRSSVSGSSTIRLNLNINVDAMITNRSSNVSLIVSSIPGTGCIINSITFYEAKYKEVTETMKFFERKYIRSVGTELGDANLDGTQKIAKSINGGGLHVPHYYDLENSFSAKDKMRMCFATSGNNKKENLGWTDVSDEMSEQQKLYTKAYSLNDANKINYKSFTPPYLEDVEQRFGFNTGGVNLVFSSPLLDWESNAYYKRFKSVSSWQPQGHMYQWSPKVDMITCWWFGDKLHAILRPEFIHRHSGEIVQPVSVFDAYYGVVKNDYYEGKAANDKALNIHHFSQPWLVSLIGGTRDFSDEEEDWKNSVLD